MHAKKHAGAHAKKPRRRSPSTGRSRSRSSKDKPKAKQASRRRLRQIPRVARRSSRPSPPRRSVRSARCRRSSVTARDEGEDHCTRGGEELDSRAASGRSAPRRLPPPREAYAASSAWYGIACGSMLSRNPRSHSTTTPSGVISSTTPRSPATRPDSASSRVEHDRRADADAGPETGCQVTGSNRVHVTIVGRPGQVRNPPNGQDRCPEGAGSTCTVEEQAAGGRVPNSTAEDVGCRP